VPTLLGVAGFAHAHRKLTSCAVPEFESLTELQRHAAELAWAPSERSPWNYRETLARIGGPESRHGPAP